MNPYGFDWGPAAITRVCHIKGRGYVLQIKTDHAEMQVHITEKGRGITAYPMRQAKVEDGPDWRGPVEHVPDPEQCECGLWSRGLVNGVCADCRDAPMDWTGA